MAYDEPDFVRNPKKDKNGLTPKQALFVEKAVEVGHVEAGRIAYPDASPKDAQVIASQNMQNPELVHNISVLANRKGLTQDACVETIKESLTATKLYGKEGIEHADAPARLRAAELGLKLHGQLKEDRGVILPVPVSKEQYMELCKTFWNTKPI